MSIEGCVNSVKIFNEIIGNLEGDLEGGLLAQVKCVKEEAIELYQAVSKAEGNEQVLKEAVDVLVTIFGVVANLEKQGYDVYGAWKHINDNNMSKFTKDKIVAGYSQYAYAGAGIITKVVYNDAYGVFVIKDEHGKARKPIDYEKASVAGFIPQY